MLINLFSSRGWESWGLEHRPLIPEQMPVLIDDDLRFEDGPGAPRPALAVNRWLQELPVSGAPAVSTWHTYGRIVKDWMEFLEVRGVSVFAGREALRVALSAYAEYRATGPLRRRFSAATWNQHVSVLASLYRWALAEGHAQAEPFSYRIARGMFAGRGGEVWVNRSARRRPKPHVTISFPTARGCSVPLSRTLTTRACSRRGDWATSACRCPLSTPSPAPGCQLARFGQATRAGRQVGEAAGFDERGQPGRC